MTFTPDNFTVWTELPVTDLKRSTAFYNAVFKTKLKLDETGPNPVAMFPTGNEMGVSGHIYPGKPAAKGAGPTIHLAIPDKLEDAMARCFDAGGKVLSDPVSIPPGRFAYATDPDGNSIGLFEPAA